MPIWSDTYLDSLMDRGEIEFSQQIPCLFTRFSLNITQGISVYTLPNGIIDIVRVTWKGDPVEPWEHAQDRENNWIKPQNLYSQGKPFYYLAYEYGYGQIKFFPVPHESVANDDTSIMSTDIENRVIVSAYRTAEPSADTYRVPSYIRRRLVKYYALMKAFKQEGKGQDLSAAKYYTMRYDLALKQFSKAVQKLPTAVQINLGSPVDSRGNKPPAPVLPTDGVWSF